MASAKMNMQWGSGISRRAFCGGAGGLLVLPGAWGWAQSGLQGTGAGTATRPDVAAIDRGRILAAAQRYLGEKPRPVTLALCPRSAGAARQYYSEIGLEGQDGSAKAAGAEPFRAHADALFEMGLRVPALAAAYVLTREARYAQAAAGELRAWFVDPGTSMLPNLDYGGVRPGGSAGTYAGVLETLPLVEVAQAIPFVAAAGVLRDEELAAIKDWFAAYSKWLTQAQDSGPRLAALARDRKDHHGTSWLLQASAYTLLTGAENGAPKNEAAALTDLRHRFRTVTLRAQISAEGMFRNELVTPTPYRNSLFNLDMLAAICELLTTRFESVWEYQLEDGPGMRVAIAYHFPFIANRAQWPFRADSDHFTELPGRRASLLFCARAYQRPEYAALWKTLTPDGVSPEVLRTIPVHQELLWGRTLRALPVPAAP